ncbi:MAG: ribonuclease III [Planctomycetota bacterium]
MTKRPDSPHGDAAPRDQSLKKLATRLGHEFRDPDLFARAFVHSSMGNEGKRSNERLEFLGDAVLELIVSDHLFRTFPDAAEGQLTDRRQRIVSKPPLAKVARELELISMLEHGRGLTGDELESERLQANLLEAVLGAIWLDGGLTAAKRFVHCEVLPRTGDGRPDGEKSFRDPKSRLLHWCQAHRLGQPKYQTLGSRGPEHQRVFEVAVLVDGEERERGEATSKQAAEMLAAEATLAALQRERQANDAETESTAQSD